MALALPLCSLARPAYPGVLSRVNPDGSSVQFRLYGDEHFSYVTDTEGMLLTYDSAGNLRYQLENGAPVKVTPQVVENLYQAQLDSQDPTSPLKAPSKMASLDGDGRTTYPTIGETRSLVVLLEYSDVKFQETSPAEIERMLNEEGYNLYGAQGSVHDYYKYNSNGQYTPIFDVTRVVELPNTSAYYTNDNKYGRFAEAILTALYELDGEIDFTDYDCDGNGEIDTVYFFYAGYGQADTGLTTAIWPHQSNLSSNKFKFDGVTLGPYACSNELNGGMHYANSDMYLDGPGTFIHEFGHVLGMPDLYDIYYSGQTCTPGNYTVMDGGSYNNEGYCPPNLSIYEKWLYKWVEYEDVVENTHYDLKPIRDGGTPLRIPVVRSSGAVLSSEYFLMESRNLTGWDSYLADHGLLIWHVNYSPSAWSSNKVNTTIGAPRMFLVAADGTSNPFLGTTGYPTYAPFPGTSVGNTYLTPDTEVTLNAFTTNLVSRTGTSYITSIAYNEEDNQSEFDYNVVTEAPDLVTTMLPPVRYKTASGMAGNGFKLSWEPIDPSNGEVEYLVTIYRYNSSGKQLFESGYNEKSVGSATSLEITGFTTTKMGLEFHAYVRVLQGIPAEEISNEVVFIPNELEISSVKEIEAVDENAPIFGGLGCITAPAGAQIFNLAGNRVAATDLPAGIYLVRAGSRTVKVIVK